MYRKLIFFILFNLFFLKVMNAQTALFEPITSMHLDLQKYADTTFVLRFIERGSMFTSPNYYILSKSSKLVNTYRYGDLTKGIEMPKAIQSKLRNASLWKDSVKVAVNAYFSPEYISKENLAKFWMSVSALRPLELKSAEANSCNKSEIYDGETYTIYVIIKDRITSTVFHDPYDKEMKCPGNKDRKTFISIDKLFKEYFHIKK